jgi:hypothetical protein
LPVRLVHEEVNTDAGSDGISVFACVHSPFVLSEPIIDHLNEVGAMLANPAVEHGKRLAGQALASRRALESTFPRNGIVELERF